MINYTLFIFYASSAESVGINTARGDGEVQFAYWLQARSHTRVFPVNLAVDKPTSGLLVIPESDFPLLTPERQHRVNSHSATGWNRGSDEDDHQENDRAAAERPRIGSGNVVQHPRENLACRQGAS